MGQIFRVIGCAALFAGPCLIIYSFLSIARTKNFLLRSDEVEGKVIRLERSKDHDEYGYTYAPVFTFTTAGGRQYTVTSDSGSSPPSFREGESVRVRYEPDHPMNARINTTFQTWGTAIVSGGAGMFCLFWGCFVLGIFNLGR
jgi:hypothetical protein